MTSPVEKEIEKQLVSMREKLSEIQDPSRILMVLNFGVYYFSCGAHAVCNEGAAREALSRLSLVDGVRYLFPACVRGCSPSRESLILSSKRPLCPNCTAVYRIDVPFGVRQPNDPGGRAHATESICIIAPRAEWPSSVTAAFADPRNELYTPLGSIYWAREESTMLLQSIISQPPPKPIADVTWEELLEMKNDVEAYVHKYAQEYIRARDHDQELLRGYMRPDSGIPEVEEMDEGGGDANGDLGNVDEDSMVDA